MTKPTLVIMAAGMGSRYGGLKQMDPISNFGEIIIDFSLYDALMAGFDRAIFIIKEEMEADMRSIMDGGAARHMDIEYAFQRLEDLPDGFRVPDGRTKPWGTCHAIIAAADKIDGNFAVINADDFYGAHAFSLMYSWLERAKDDDRMRYSMVGYELRNTLTEHGSVARGVCDIDESGYLRQIDERLKIIRRDGTIAYTEDDKTWIKISEDTTVSMNLWGFTPSFLVELKQGFPTFLNEALRNDPLKAEYLLPRKIDELIKNDKASVKVMKTDDHWYGVTYKEDKEYVVNALQSLKDSGAYPEKLWR
jgi:dTDP-glucose pyrophosphorylase